jgi:Fe-S oxidoreductase
MSLMEGFTSSADEISAACTTCGKCYDVCPVVEEKGFDVGAGVHVVEQLKRLTAGQDYAQAAADWAQACNGSGQCLDACPEQLDVRKWLAITKLNVNFSTRPDRDRKEAASQQFRTMAQAVKLLATMQLSPSEKKTLLAPADGRHADVVFYYGCNVLRSPHLIFNVMDILDTIDVRYEVLGGTANCCGVLQFNAGDAGTYENISGRTADAFTKMGAKEVVTWCPTCQIQFGEINSVTERTGLDIGHVTLFLQRQLPKIRPLLRGDRPIRAVLHEHGGLKGVVEGVKELMSAVPGLELIDVSQLREFGYQCSRVAPYPEKQAEVHRTVAENAQAAGADMIITIYHGCHRQLVGAEGQYDFEVLNFTDVLAQSLGRGRDDHYKKYKRDGDIVEALALAEEFLRQNGITLDEKQVDLLRKEIFLEPGFTNPGHAAAAMASDH